MSSQSIPDFTKFVNKESCVLLSHKECSCCGADMEDRPYGVFGVSMTYKPAPEADRLYFPLYHLVCKGCFDIVHFAMRLKEDFDFFVNPKNQPNQPEWSNVRALAYGTRPHGVAILDNRYMLIELFETMAWETSSWEEFSKVANCETMVEFLSA
jgi:hypothetical protein